jgi:hypothetical protein
LRLVFAFNAQNEEYKNGVQTTISTLDSYFQENWHGHPLAPATALDPRMKFMLWEPGCFEVTSIVYAKETVRQTWKNYLLSTTLIRQSRMQTIFRQENFDDDEFERYIANYRLPATNEFDVLNYWKVSTWYPNLRKLAKKYLAIPASSRRSARAFWQANLFDADLPEEADPQLLSKMMLLKSWRILLDNINNQ